MPQSLSVRKFVPFAVLASIINSIIFQIAKSSDATMIVNQEGSREISVPMVLASTLFGLIFAAYVASLIGRKSQGFLTKLPIVGLLFGVITAAAPFAASDDSKTSLGLASMHVVAGLIWYVGAKRSIN